MVQTFLELITNWPCQGKTEITVMPSVFTTVSYNDWAALSKNPVVAHLFRKTSFSFRDFHQKQTGLSQISALKWSNRSSKYRSGENRVQTQFVKSSGHDAIHLAGPPTGRRPQQRPASSRKRLVARRRVAPPRALFTALLIKVIAGVSVAERRARETRGWQKERGRENA